MKLNPDRLLIALHHSLLVINWIVWCDGKKLTKPETCPTWYYFHTFSLECVTCWNSVPPWLANQTINSSSPSPDRTQCHCPDQYRMRLTNGRFDCFKVSCLPVCPECHSSLLSSDGQSCQCPQPTNVLEDGVCLPRDKIISSEKLITFSTLLYRSKSFVSKFIYSSLRPALFNCRFHLNQTACQYLINVLSLKSAAEQVGITWKDDDSKVLQAKINEALVDGFNLSQSDAPPTDLEAHFRNQFQCQTPERVGNNLMDLAMLKFVANGSLNQFGAINLDQLSLCSPSGSFDQVKLFPGVYIHRKFWCRTDKLGIRNTFNQLFGLSSITKDLHPFTNPSGSSRFFLVNGLLEEPEFVLYAKSITLEMLMMQQLPTPTICPGSIRIQYDLLEKDKLVRTELKVEYRMDETDPELDQNALMIVCLIIIPLAIIWSGFRTWCLMNRNGHSRLEWKIYLIFGYHLMVTISNILLVAIYLWCLNRTMVYKYQTVVHTVMLDWHQELVLIHCLLVVFCFKMIQLIATIIHSTSMEIFLIDWERPKNNKNSSNHRIVETIHEKRSSSKHDPEEVAKEMDNVSVWRRIFVGNEWCELSTVRRINLSLHLLLITTILESVYFKRFYKLAPELYLTSANFNGFEEIPESLTIRMTVMATTFLILVLVQYLYQKWIKENFFGSKLNEFIDLCSVSNISVFCLAYRKYGYYIHGLSPHGQSDVGMLQMYRLLDIEQSDLCSKRGLLPNTDQQTFQMYLPTIVHDYMQAIRDQSQQDSNSKRPLRDVNDSPIRSMKISVTINQFLTTFIAHKFPKADYIVEEKRGLQAMFDFESESDSFSVSEGIGFFYNDSNDLMENALLYGLEPTLIIIELMTFLLVDLLWQSFIIDALITYSVSMAIRGLFGKFFRKNLIQKALIDERFLF